jgi:hypothetical protein
MGWLSKKRQMQGAQLPNNKAYLHTSKQRGNCSIAAVSEFLRGHLIRWKQTHKLGRYPNEGMAKGAMQSWLTVKCFGERLPVTAKGID